MEEQIDKFVWIKLSLDFNDLNCEGKNIAVSMCNIWEFKKPASGMCSSQTFLKLVLHDLPCGEWL